MKRSRLTPLLILFVALASCSKHQRPGTITPEQSSAHVGQSVTVEGTVSEVHTARSGSATFIDMGGSYPANAFSGVIFANDMEIVGDVSDLTGKTVDIQGVVRMYRGKPEIIISSRDQVTAR